MHALYASRGVEEMGELLLCKSQKLRIPFLLVFYNFSAVRKAASHLSHQPSWEK